MSFALSGVRLLAVLPCRSGSLGDRGSAVNLSALLKKDRFPRKILAGNSSYDTESTSTTVATSGKVLIPGGQIDVSSSSVDSIENPPVTAENLQAFKEVADTPIEEEGKIEGAETPISSEAMVEEKMNEGVKELVHSQADKSNKKFEEKQRVIPPPGTGQTIYKIDLSLIAHRAHLDYRYGQYKKIRGLIDQYEGGLDAFSCGYQKFGFNRSATGITYREWAPGAKSAALIGDFNNWNSNADVMTRNEFGVWEIFLPNNEDGSPAIPHGSRVKYLILWIAFAKKDSPVHQGSRHCGVWGGSDVHSLTSACMRSDCFRI